MYSGYNMLLTMLQFDSAVDILINYMKEAGAEAGLHPQESSISSFYQPDMQYNFYVWIPEVSTTPLIAF